MCGIVGAISASPVDEDLIVKMRDRMVHRGPDHAGIWRSTSGRVCLGHRRLAIVDLSAQANQPFASFDGRFVITYNGEIYNFRQIRAELQARNVAFRTDSDTEVLVEAFRRWGVACLNQFVGMFAFAIWDTVQGRLFCARDRVGEKPFYHAQVGNSFIFASEVKALLLWPGVSPEIDYTALADYMCFGFVPDPKCIWKGCHKLSPGHWLNVETDSAGLPNATVPRAYWDFEIDPDYSVTNWEPRIRDVLQRSSEEMTVADVRLGSFLSGGVDSSSVTAALGHTGVAASTFTIGFQEAEFDERSWAREVAERYGCTHTEKVVVPRDVDDAYETLLWHYDEPFNDYSFVPMYYLCREARRHITVALSGDGGDETFAGYHKYQRIGLRQNIERIVPGCVVRLLARTGGLFFPEPSRLGNRLQPYAFDHAGMLVNILANCFPPSALRASARGPLRRALDHYDPSDTVHSLLQNAPPSKVGTVNAMRYLDLKLTLAGDILVKVDRSSMAVSLEVRPVYLHREMMDLARRIPSRLLVSGGQSKRVLKSALRPWLSDDLLYRRKQGFAMPLPTWMNGQLGGMFAGNDGGQLLNELIDPDALMLSAAGRECKGHVPPLAAHNLLHLKRWLGKWHGCAADATHHG